MWIDWIREHRQIALRDIRRRLATATGFRSGVEQVDQFSSNRDKAATSLTQTLSSASLSKAGQYGYRSSISLRPHWLVQNQDKQGTQQFATVANAYKQLRQQGQRQQTT